MMEQHRIVSSEQEELILVDADDREIGSLDKAACHDGAGVLHRAFSLFIFDARGELLLQQRSAGKRLWPLYWSNSCCSHPRRGETMAEATARRLGDELHIAAELEFIYKFAYAARYDASGSENELCWVYLGRTGDAIIPNENEIAAVRTVSAEALDDELSRHPDRFTPWLKLEWQALRTRHARTLHQYLEPAL
ncbi:MAG TPA: isopentenyl-diphosphate Delta-isomerase [Woeseiaceae bacterium]|nr:isopentenyl-diphosphate Delta-isomerase [Woeseiaceae bacterium]